MRSPAKIKLAGAILCLLGALSGTARAQIPQGFQLNRYEPTSAGEFFFAVDHPWYSATRYFAGGLTLDYNHNALVARGANDAQLPNAVVEHQLQLHLDLAISFLNRFRIDASLPLTLAEYGTAAGGAAPYTGGLAPGDVRLGLMIRLIGEPLRDAFTLHLGADVWIPIGDNNPQHTSDHGPRVYPRLVASGVSHYIRWSLSGGYLFRHYAIIGDGPDTGGNVVGSSLQFGAAIGYVNESRRLTVGPEMTVSILADGASAWKADATSIEILGGANYIIGNKVLIGLALGGGGLIAAGTPDFRALLRLAWAPQPGNGDRDGDGILDRYDACPDVPGVASDNPNHNGCPDRDHDGVFDVEDICPDVPKGDHPDPNRLGCPAGDRDKDGVLDPEDVCPDVPAGPHPDPSPARKGCPIPDRDGDGVLDPDDMCPDVPMGDHPDPKRLGCPALDTDGDGVYDYEDVCPEIPAGAHPDPNPERKGCPEPDRDHDTVRDSVDACPDTPGVPTLDPKTNGCPSPLVKIQNNMIVILQQVYFANDKDIILPKSFPLLTAVRDIFLAEPEIKLVEVQGHTSSTGTYRHNMDLSHRRANSVMRWLVGHGVTPDRLQARGYGPNRPIADNRSKKGQDLNRRVEFHILVPAPTADGVVPIKGTVPGLKEEAPGVETVPLDTPVPQTGPNRYRWHKGGKGKAGRLKGKAGKGKRGGGRLHRKH